MTLTILPLAPQAQTAFQVLHKPPPPVAAFVSDEEMDVDEVKLSSKRIKFSSAIITPGEMVTDDPQWMR